VDIVDEAGDERTCIEGFAGTNVETAIQVFQRSQSLGIFGNFCVVHMEVSVRAVPYGTDIYPRKYVALFVFISMWYTETCRKISEIETKFWYYSI